MALLGILNRQTVSFVITATITIMLFNIIVNFPLFNKLVEWPQSLILLIVIIFVLYNKNKIVLAIAGPR